MKDVMTAMHVSISNSTTIISYFLFVSVTVCHCLLLSVTVCHHLSPSVTV